MSKTLSRGMAKTTQRAVITKAVLEKLIRNDISPGESISEEDLAQQFGVSRTPVREALILLERQQMTVNEANRGFFAAPISFEGLRSYFEMASHLYPFIFWRASEASSEIPTWEDMGARKTSPPEEAGDSVISHFALVSWIAEASNNAFSAEVAISGESYHCMMRRSILSARPQEVVNSANRELWARDCALIEALESRDRARMDRAIEEFITSSREFILSNMI